MLFFNKNLRIYDWLLFLYKKNINDINFNQIDRNLFLKMLINDFSKKFAFYNETQVNEETVFYFWNYVLDFATFFRNTCNKIGSDVYICPIFSTKKGIGINNYKLLKKINKACNLSLFLGKFPLTDGFNINHSCSFLLYLKIAKII